MEFRFWGEEGEGGGWPSIRAKPIPLRERNSLLFFKRWQPFRTLCLVVSSPVVLFQLMCLQVDVRSRGLTTEGSSCDSWLWTSRCLGLRCVLTWAFSGTTALFWCWVGLLPCVVDSHPPDLWRSTDFGLQFLLTDWMGGSSAQKSSHFIRHLLWARHGAKGLRHINSFYAQSRSRK